MTVNRKMIYLPFKKDKKVDLGNYRLISLSSVLGKTIEDILKKAVSRHIKDKNTIRNSQLVFIPWQIMLGQSDSLLW